MGKTKVVMPGGEIISIENWVPTDLVLRTDATPLPRMGDKEEYVCSGAEIFTEEDLPPTVLFLLSIGAHTFTREGRRPAVSLCARTLCERDRASSARLARLEAAVYKDADHVMPAQGVFAQPVYIRGGEIYRVELTDLYTATVRLFGFMKRRIS